MTESATEDDLVYDPHAEGLTPERAFDLYARLRAQCPVARNDAHGGYWAISRYKDVRAAAGDYRRFSSAGGNFVPPISDFSFPPIEHDPPEHGKFRDLISPLTSAAAATEMEPRIQATVDGLIDRMLEKGSAELIEDFALPLPLDVITQLYDLGPEDVSAIRTYSLAFLEHGSDKDRAREIIAEVADYWIKLFADRRRNPTGDFVSQLVAKSPELGEPDEVLANMMFVLTYAGHDSTSLAIGNTLRHLAEHHDDQERLRRDESLIPMAIEEILRYETPVHWFPRVATTDVEIGGQTITTGERVLLIYGSANRDEEAFPNADHVVIDRSPNRHMSFGFGIHVCPGQPLAKTEMRIAVTTLLRRLPPFRINGKVERTEPLEGGGRHLGVRKLPVTW
jgi:cytochrome P450